MVILSCLHPWLDLPSLSTDMSKESEERKHHATLSPSAFPAFDKCPCFKSSPNSGPAAKRGTELHDQFEEVIKQWQQSK